MEKPEQIERRPLKLNINDYDKLVIDSILYRELAARRALELANRDLEDVTDLRNEMFESFRKKFNLDDSWSLEIDMHKKTVVAVPKQK